MTETRETPNPARDEGDARGRAERGSRTQRLPLPARISLFYRQVIAEMRKVIWPTRKELITYTSVVIVFVLIVIVFVTILDFFFSKLILAVFG